MAGQNRAILTTTKSCGGRFARQAVENPIITTHAVGRSAKELYQKYTAVKAHCLRMLSSERETYFAEEYYLIIDYIVGCEQAPSPIFRNEFEDMPTLPPSQQETPNYIDILD